MPIWLACATTGPARLNFGRKRYSEDDSPTYASHFIQQSTPAQPTPLTSYNSPLLPNLRLSRHTAAHSCPTYASDVTQQPTPAQPTPLTSHISPLLPNLRLSRHTTAHSCPTYASHVIQQPTPAQPTPLTSHSSPLLPDTALHHQLPTTDLPQNHQGMEHYGSTCHPIYLHSKAVSCC